jgi:STE24 endopeptidase
VAVRRADVPGLDAFSGEEVERARRYHRPLYVAAAADLLLSLALLTLLAFTPLRDWVDRRLAGLPWWAQTLSWVAVIMVASFVIRLPLSYWRGFRREHEWGFSTQPLRGWVADRLKGLAVGLVLSATATLGLIALARTLPRTWPWVVAPAGVALVVLLSFVAPVLLEPIFNRFEPLDDAALAEDLRALSLQAGVPVSGVLVADASRRTTKENAYVSGLGRTRRVVLHDTLLRRAGPPEVRLVVAHELGHRRLRHVLKSTLLGGAAVVAVVIVLWLLLRSGAILHVVGATGAGDPRVVPFVFLVVAVLQLVALPFGSALSRRWESAADRFSLHVTKDLDTFERAHHRLGLSNLADLDPPRAIYLAVFTHPTPPERIAAGRRWAGSLPRS